MTLFPFLEMHDVAYKHFTHPPVFTCDEARLHVPDLGAAETKNLFVKDKKGRNHFLVVMGYGMSVNLKALSALLGVKNLSFCSPDRLMTYLGVEPGAVTMLGLVNDSEKIVQLVIDNQLWEADAFCCHPLVNTATLVIDKANLEKFFLATGHPIKIINLPHNDAVQEVIDAESA